MRNWDLQTQEPVTRLYPTSSGFDGAGLGRILLVGHEQSTLCSLEMMLQSIGYKITVCSTPDGVICYEMKDFDLAILDCDLPRYDCRALLLRMRALHAAFPIILISGAAHLLATDIQVLFSGCVSKPASDCELLALVARYLDRNALPDFH